MCEGPTAIFVFGCVVVVVVVVFCCFWSCFCFVFVVFNLVDGNLLGKGVPDIQTGDAKRETFPTYSLHGGQCRSITP